MSFMTFIQGLFGGAPAASAPVAPSVPVSIPLPRLQDAIAAVGPHCDAAAWASVLTPPMRSSGITTPHRMAAFLGQVAVESGGLTTLGEFLNYSAARLCAVWPDMFPTPAAASPYVANPVALANRVYANRLGNGDEASGDGWKFRGAGLIQLTGRANQEAFASAMKMDLETVPDWLRTPPGAAASACWFWSTHSLNGLADGWQITAISHRVNGGSLGLAERIELSNAALAVLQPDGVSA